jgi:hypothetical protein
MKLVTLESRTLHPEQTDCTFIEVVLSKIGMEMWEQDFSPFHRAF